MNVNQFHNLEYALGTRFLEYILNYDGLVWRRQLEEYGFNRRQLSGAKCLLDHVVKSYASTARSTLLSYAGLVDEFNRIRSKCGGEFPRPEFKTDKMLEYLQRRAVECYPLLLLKEDEHRYSTWGWSGLSRVHGTLAEAEFVVSLFRQDRGLRALLRGEGEVFRIAIVFALDNSIRVQTWASNFCGDFIEGAFAACCYRGNYGLQDLLDEIATSLMVLRKIGLGEPVPVFFYRGIYGLRLDKNELHELDGQTRLRNIDDLSNPLTWTTMSTGRTEERSDILLGCVLEHEQVAAPVRVVDSEEGWTVSWNHFEKLTDDLVMSFVLDGQHKRAPVGKTFTDIYVPLYRHLPRVRENVRGGITCLNELEVESVTKWFNLLRAVDVDRVRIPLQRIQVALYERDSPVDALLDFFIAWESMFSHDWSTTNSVVRSMEVMLARAGRAVSRKRLNELYGLRSAIVHGGAGESGHPELMTAEAREGVRDEVCDVALIVLSELLKDQALLLLTPQQRVMSLLKPTKVKREFDALKFPDSLGPSQ